MKLLPRKRKKHLKTIKFETLTCIIYENFILMRIRRKICEQKMASSKDYQQMLAVIVRFFLKMLKTKIRTKCKSEISVGSNSSLSQTLWTRTKVINSRMKHGAELSSSHISEKNVSQKTLDFGYQWNRFSKLNYIMSFLLIVFKIRNIKLIENFENVYKMMISELVAKKSYLSSSTLSQTEKKLYHHFLRFTLKLILINQKIYSKTRVDIRFKKLNWIRNQKVLSTFLLSWFLSRKTIEIT